MSVRIKPDSFNVEINLFSLYIEEVVVDSRYRKFQNMYSDFIFHCLFLTLNVFLFSSFDCELFPKILC